VRAANLIPPEQRRGAGGIAGRTGGIVYVVLATLVALVLLGVVYALAVHEVASRTTTLAQVNDENANVNAQVDALQPYVQFESLAQGRIEGVVQVAEQRFDWPRAMAQIALALPSNVTLASLGGVASGGGAAAASAGATGTTGPAASTGVPGVTVNAPSLAVTGCASGDPSKGQVTVAKMLARSRALEGVSSASLSTYSTSTCGGVAFTMTITYANGYGIPTAPMKAARDTTVGG
jgi:Tfp pilus assembly protein PilN